MIGGPVARGILDRVDQRDRGFESLHRRQEHAEMSVARLEGERGLDHVARCDRAHATALGLRSLRQGIARRERIDGRLAVVVFGLYPRQRIERQPQAHRRVAGDEVEPLAPQGPGARFPRTVRHRPQRKDEPRRLVDDGLQELREARALVRRSCRP
jgi:hypothetical protein